MRNSIVGFTLRCGLSDTAVSRHDKALRRTLSHFPWLRKMEYTIGQSNLEVWGHGEINECVHKTADGDLLVLIGSPRHDVPWEDVETSLSELSGNSDSFVLPWEGRVILLRIDTKGDQWVMWNDWVGSLPVFHAHVGQGRVASTLEPVVVAAAGYTANDFSLTGMMAMLLVGHFVDTITLFEGMETVPPDSVAEWTDGVYRTKQLRTVEASDERWAADWEDLIEEMHALAQQAIGSLLATEPQWILPLSGGLDSRLIAAIGSEQGTRFHAYSYGPEGYIDTTAPRQVAKALRIPWQRVDIGPDHLVKYTRMWCDWFGSALHVHGMYQMPFLEHLLSQPAGPMVHGYVGDLLSGAGVRIWQRAGGASDPANSVLFGRSRHWKPDEAETLFNEFPRHAFEWIQHCIHQQYETLVGADWQRLDQLVTMNRAPLFASYHLTMYDYWRGVGIPYIHRDYARFCWSLPLHAAEDRRLLKDIIRRRYPDLARIPGTYGVTIIPRRYGWLLNRHERILRTMGRRLPKSLRLGPLAEFDFSVNTMEQDALEATGEEALWPLNVCRKDLEPWFDLTVLEEVYQAALEGHRASYWKLMPIQAIALHLLKEAEA